MAGRRVYRNSGGRKFRKNALNILLIILSLVVVVFLIYSISGPIANYFKNRAIESEAEPWRPAPLPDQLIAENNIEKENPVTPIDEPSNANIKSTQNFSACFIPVTSMASSETLKDALQMARADGYTAAVVTLKDKGGSFYYNTSSEMAGLADNAVKSDLTAEHICTLIKAAGLKPIASVNLLEDHNIYGGYKQGAYKFENSTSTWYDNRVESGGKPWLSPFEADTKDFVAFISDEVSKAGFESIIFDGIVFPPFRQSDLNYIGSTVKAADRYLGLVNIANIATEAANKNGAASMLKITAEDIITGSSEVFKPDLLDSNIILVYYAPENFIKTIVINGDEIVLSDMIISDSTEVVFNIILEAAGDKEIIPHLDSAGLTQADFNDVITALIKLGFGAYVIS